MTTAFGVRLAGGSPFTDAELPAKVRTVLIPGCASSTVSSPSPADLPGRRELVEVTDREEARLAARSGAHGLSARGHEAGGRIGELSTFVLLQQLLTDAALELPVWACGGIGPHTAAAAVAGGAAGVVLDTQLALLAEADLPTEITATISTLDGSETTVVNGQRVLLRRGAAAAEHAQPLLRSARTASSPPGSRPPGAPSAPPYAECAMPCWKLSEPKSPPLPSCPIRWQARLSAPTCRSHRAR
jgi:hypothetical protein